MARIGVFGGTFNPPHAGHIRAAEQAIAALKLDRLLFLPDRCAHGKTLPPDTPAPEDRLAILRIAAQSLPNCEVWDHNFRMDGPGYTCLAIEALQNRCPHDELFLLLGSDKLSSFLQWWDASRITDACTLAVLYRGERGERDQVRQDLAGLESWGAKVCLVENDPTPISSSQLRRLLAFGCADSFLPLGVEAYIRSRGLYARPCRHLSIEELEKTSLSLLKENRVAHVRGCRQAAVELARHWGADQTDAARAALLHDVTKALDGSLQLTLCAGYGIVLDAFSRKYPKTLHALTGSLVAERIFGENEAVVSAIRHHTTGKANMSLLEKIIYVADYMEPNRDFPGVDTLRALAYSDIDAALKLGLEMTLEHLKRQGSEVSPESREALAWLNQQEESSRKD